MKSHGFAAPTHYTGEWDVTQAEFLRITAQYILYSKKSFTGRLMALSILLIALLFAFNTTSIFAETNPTGPTGEEEPTLAVPYMYEKLDAWRDRILIDQVWVGEISILQIDLFVDSIDDYGFDIEEFATVLLRELASGKLPYKRAHVDLSTILGERLESHDMDLCDMTNETATFPRNMPPEDEETDETGEPIEDSKNDVPEGHTQIGQIVSLGKEVHVIDEVEVHLDQYGVFENDEGTYVKLWFTFVNNKDGQNSAGYYLFRDAYQNDVELERYFGTDYATNPINVAIAKGESIDNATLYYYLENDIDNVDIDFMRKDTRETATISLPIADFFVE